MIKFERATNEVTIEADRTPEIFILDLA